MQKLTKKIFKSNLQIGKSLFYIGLFLLPSAIALSLIFLFISLLISYLDDFKNKFNDRVNLTFLVSCLLLSISSIVNFLDKSSINNYSNNGSLTFIGLLNWIPMIFAFIGFQKYLLFTEDRKKCVSILIFGSIPVIFSCFAQFFFNWHGPMETLYGLIVWYQRPIEGFSGITGLFNNPNYLAAWLNIIWPFSLVMIIFDNKNKVKLSLKLMLIISISLLIVLTFSRAGWIGLLIPIIFLYRSTIKLWILGFITFISIIIANLLFPYFGTEFYEIIQKFIPKGIWINFTQLEYQSLDISRLEIWRYAIKFIANHPIFGNGSKAFTSLLREETGFWKGHSHNLPLELMVNYGIPAALLILLPIIYLLLKAYMKLFIKNYKLNKISAIDRAWIISLTSLMVMHLVDIQYFDGRISLAGWILLAGTRNLILDSQDKRFNELKSQNV